MKLEIQNLKLETRPRCTSGLKPETSDSAKVNILLVDDHSENLLALEATLASLDQNLVKARSGNEALKQLLKDEFAAILLDVQMPGMDGFETAALIRERKKSRHTPIIFLTAVNTSETHVTRGYSLGAVDYMFKPIIPEILRAKVAVFVDLFHERRKEKRLALELSKANEELKSEMTERKRVEKELRESEERFRQAFGQAGVGMALLGLDWRFLDANEALCHSLGYSREELADLTLRMLTHTTHRDSDEDRVAQLKRGEIPYYQFERQFLLKSGETPWFRVTVSLMRDEQAEPLYVIAQMEDITWRKEAEQSLRQRSEALERSNRELEQFAYVASHDLQEPLRMVGGYTQLLQRRYQGKLDTDADEFIAYIVEGVIRMQALINDLLVYSRVGTGGKEFEPADCETTLDLAVANLQTAIQEHSATVTHDPLPTVTADPTQLVQLFQNLIGNAVKFHGEDSPCVHVSAEKKGRDWLFSVRDNGIGIDPQYAERIFVIFQRLHGKGAYPGTGIGLAICKKIVERHGGRIGVKSHPGKGSTFYFTIPDKGAPL